jgi:SNF2 family DNA or RNA helicase
MPKEFGLKNTKKNGFPQLNIVHLVFIFCVGIIFSLSILYGRIHLFLSSDNKVDLFKENLQQIAVYFLPVDKQFSKFLVDLDVLIKSYIAGDNILVTQNTKIEELRAYTQKNKNYLKKIGFTQYEPVIDLVADLRKYKDHIFALLGKEKIYNYLVILQNTNEKRPNG